MRRMRDLAWQYYLLALPVIAIVASAGFLVKDRYRGSGDLEMRAEKISTFRQGASSPSEASDAKSNDAKSNDASANTTAAAKASLKKLSALADDLTDDLTDPNADPSENSDARAAVATPIIRAAGATCATDEYLGAGPELARVTQGQWAQVMARFHESKTLLLDWLARHRTEFSPAALTYMEVQIKELRIQRPPTTEEPDLAWRGIGAYTQDGNQIPLVRIGGGFLKLLEKNPKGAQFELTRLVAQAWAPCELEKGNFGKSWEPLLKCLGVNEAQGCTDGSYSESGWAVSSALASILANPGCSIPALADASTAACVRQVAGLPLQNQEITKEARR